jgi:hypothetical protein
MWYKLLSSIDTEIEVSQRCALPQHTKINGQNCQMVRIVVMYTSISFGDTVPKHIVENFGNFAADFDLVCVSLCVCVCVRQQQFV